ncbi:MAG: glycoside hydrolase family protein [Candidatus Thiodiazotropha endolucinida]
MENILEQLQRHEGSVIEKGRHMPYTDSEGHLTIGYGHNLEYGIPQFIADQLLRYDYAQAVQELRQSYVWYDELDKVRQDVLSNMCFNLGIERFGGFVRMIAAIEAGDYEEAAIEMLDSKWATQVGDRADELSEQMRTCERSPNAKTATGHL